MKMESKYDFKKIDIGNPTCYYFDYIIKIEVLILIIFKRFKTIHKCFGL